VLACDNIGQITYGTSARISGFQSETMIKAVKYERNVIDITHQSWTYLVLINGNITSEAESNNKGDIYMIYKKGKEYLVFLAEQSIKSTKSIKKEAFDGIYLPKHSQVQLYPRPQESWAMQALRIPEEWLGHPRLKIPPNKLLKLAKLSMIP
ncbi:hypothetical protein HETIRDRAFT_331280, partial [Heterobasidion irregulare TC 32-1]